MSILLLLGGSLAVRAQNNVAVTNWPDGTAPLPVTLTDINSPNMWPSFSLGMGTGFLVCGFGWILRFARKSGGANA